MKSFTVSLAVVAVLVTAFGGNVKAQGVETYDTYCKGDYKGSKQYTCVHSNNGKIKAEGPAEIRVVLDASQHSKLQYGMVPHPPILHFNS